MATFQNLRIDALEDDEFRAANPALEMIVHWFRGQYRLRDNDGDKLKKSISRQQDFKGGWEKWLQNELALFLEAQIGYNTKDGREKYIYIKRGFVDLWCVPYSLGDGSGLQQKEALGIELKCGIQGKSCQEGFMEDVDKVRAGIKPEFIGPAAIEVGLSNAGRTGVDNSRGPWIKTVGTTMLCIALTTQPSDLHNLQTHMGPELKAAAQRERLPFYYKKLWTATRKDWDKQWAYEEGPVDMWIMWHERHFYK